MVTLVVTVDALKKGKQGCGLICYLTYVNQLTLIGLHGLPRCCALQADSEELRQAWINAVQGSIDMAYREKEETRQPQVT